MKGIVTLAFSLGIYLLLNVQVSNATNLDVKNADQIVPTIPPIWPLCWGSTAPLLPSISTNGITGTWNPSVISTTANDTVTYVFTPDAGQNATVVKLDVVVFKVLPTFAQIGPLLLNSTAPILPTTSTNGITGTWSPATIPTTVAGVSGYTFVPTAGQCAPEFKMGISVVTALIPMFNQIGPICQNAAAPLLPTTSTNGIKGTWNPSTISTATAGTVTYTFTPMAGQSATAATLDIEISAPIAPVFSVIGPLSLNSVAPVLSTTSNNGITGTWSPSTISTLQAGTTTYTFTPTSGQCATNSKLDVQVSNATVPQFNAIGPLCLNSLAPVLPTTSTNGISGTWSPSTISTSVSGTTTYTFTPAPGQNAATATLDVKINESSKPVFNTFGPICLNSAAPVLPTTSANGIAGTWSPATISTLTDGITVHTFVPTPGQCATTATLDVEISAPIAPVFSAIGPLFLNSVAPVLSTTSNNGVTGTWSPATISTLLEGTTTYTFTPTTGLCATNAKLDILISNSTVPQFNAIEPLCQHSVAPVLPTTSTNGISGTWSPSTVNTSVVGTTTYTFTPAAGQSATTATLNVKINNLADPLFNTIGPLCQNSTVPVLSTNSNNGIAGTWSPVSVSTLTEGTTTYTFTPISGQCASIIFLDIKIIPPTTPVFSAIGPLSQNSIAPLLPTISINGITGSWNPAIISTQASGTTKYSFIPTEGQCAVPTNFDIVVEEPLKTGVGLTGENELKIYPNPVTETMWVENIDQSKLWDMTILSISGEKITSYKISSAKTEIDVSKLTSGVYFFQFENTKERVILKVLKE